jgi:hypothetical protein
VAALIMVAGANAATVRVAISGSATVAAHPQGDPATAIALSGVTGDLVYTGIGTSTGSVTLTLPSAPPFAGATGPGAALTAFHGDVSQGCVRVQGSYAVVIGHLPVSEQFDIPFGHMEWVGAFLEDNGVAGASPLDRARGVFFRTTSGANACNPSNSGIWDNFPGILGALDAGDFGYGYTDRLDAHPSNPDTDASVVSPNGLGVSITDAPDPQGVSVAVGAGTGSAELSSCGLQVNVAAGSTAVLTCASLIAEVVTGVAEVVLADGLTIVSIPEGGKVEVAPDGAGGYTVANLGSVPVTVTVDGVEGTIEPGETDTLQAWDFEGFDRPVDALPTLNQVKAGSAVPLKWRVLDASGTPETGLSAASITVNTIDCTTAEGIDQIEQALSLGSGLQNLGDGYYQLNWKTSKSWDGTCQAMQLDIGDGVTHDGLFDFRK